MIMESPSRRARKPRRSNHGNKDPRRNREVESSWLHDPCWDAVAQAVCTFNEIERDLESASSQIVEGYNELALFTTAQANARAILLLVAQVKRVADALERQLDQYDDEVERQERLALYRSQ